MTDGTYSTHYTYDGLGQLLRTDDPTDIRGGGSGSTWAYSYDAGGNITSKTLYAYCPLDDDLSDNTAVHNYPYAYDTTWKDKLISYDGNTISYPSTGDIGNPTDDGTWEYTWEAGRQLKEMSNGSTTLEFKYNNAGLRTQKTNGTTITKYYWAGSVISHITKGSDILHFYYDAAGMPTMVTYNGANFYYQHNLKGDIIALMDMTGNMVVSYTYDSWGKQLSCTGSLVNTLGVVNPLRYRGYILDDETGLYYLQSRYYNPDMGRFISGDVRIGAGNTLVAYNIFTYCLNNPISLSDIEGNIPGNNIPKPDIGDTVRKIEPNLYNDVYWFAEQYEPVSIYLHFEFGGVIVDDGSIINIMPLGVHGGSFNTVTNNKRIIGLIHTHPHSNSLSKADILCADHYKVPIFAATPSGNVVEYDPYTTNKKSIGTFTIGSPSNELVSKDYNECKVEYEKHAAENRTNVNLGLRGCGFGCGITEFYPSRPRNATLG